MAKGGGGGRGASAGSKGVRMAMKVAEGYIKAATRAPYSTKRLSAASKYLKINKTKRAGITFTTVSMAGNTPKYLKPPKGTDAKQRYYRAIAEHSGQKLPAIFPGRFQ